MKQVGMAMTDSLIGSTGNTLGRITMLDGSHLFPMEKPLATAAAIEASLRKPGRLAQAATCGSVRRSPG